MLGQLSMIMAVMMMIDVCFGVEVVVEQLSSTTWLGTPMAQTNSFLELLVLMNKAPARQAIGILSGESECQRVLEDHQLATMNSMS